MKNNKTQGGNTNTESSDLAPTTSTVQELPLGALHNGEALANRLENIYDFECEAGPLRNCYEWTELLRCMAAIREWFASTTSTVSAPDLRFDCNVCSGYGHYGDGRDVRKCHVCNGTGKVAAPSSAEGTQEGPEEVQEPTMEGIMAREKARRAGLNSAFDTLRTTSTEGGAA